MSNPNTNDISKDISKTYLTSYWKHLNHNFNERIIDIAVFEVLF